MTAWLIDKSALARLAASPGASQWTSRIQRSLVRITPVVQMCKWLEVSRSGVL